MAVLLDAYSRRVIGWAAGKTGLDHTLPLAALRMALAKRRPRPGLVHHSDRGVQYACQAYTQLLDPAPDSDQHESQREPLRQRAL